MWRKEKRKGLFYTIPRKREVLSVKFQKKLEQREERLVLSWERERIHVYACTVYNPPPK